MLIIILSPYHVNITITEQQPLQGEEEISVLACGSHIRDRKKSSGKLNLAYGGGQVG